MNDNASAPDEDQISTNSCADEEDYELMYLCRLSVFEQNLTSVETRLKSIFGDGFHTLQEAKEDCARDAEIDCVEEAFRCREILLKMRTAWVETQLEKIVPQRVQMMQRHLRAAACGTR